MFPGFFTTLTCARPWLLTLLLSCGGIWFVLPLCCAAASLCRNRRSQFSLVNDHLLLGTCFPLVAAFCNIKLENHILQWIHF